MIKNIKYSFLVVVLMLTFNTHRAHAQCCSGGVPMSSNLGLPAGSVGALQLGLNYDLNVLKTYKTGTMELDRLRKRTTHSVLFQAGYTFTNWFSVEGFLSWVRQERIILSSEDFQYTQGIGDAVILFKIRPTPINSPTTIQLGIGPKIPLGSSDERNTAGFIESADLQPGSGSWDGIAWTSISQQLKFRPSMSASLTATYRFTGKNNNYLGNSTYQFGNEFQAVAGIADKVAVGTMVIDPSLVFRFRTVEQDSFDGDLAPNTGGDFLYIIPGFSVSITPKLAYNLSVELPLYSEPEMTQVVPTYRINTGLSYTLQTKKDNEFGIDL